MPSQKLNVIKEGEDIYAHLSEHERQISKMMQLDLPPVDVSFRTLYCYVTRNDFLIITLGSICALARGTALSLLMVYTDYSFSTSNANVFVIDHIWKPCGHFPILLE